MNTRDVDIFGYSLGGSVSEMMNPQPPQRRLPSMTPAQSANFAGSFVPGAALAEALGEYPATPSAEMTTAEMLAGPRAPSLAENISEGNLGTGIMQLLGAAGDAAYAIPLAGPVIGSVLKAPRALQKLARLEDAGIGSLPQQAPMNLDEQAELLGAVRFGAQIETPVMTTDVFNTFGKEGVKKLERAFKSNQEDLITAEDLIQRSSSANPAFQQTIEGIANDVGGKKAPKFITTKKGEQFDVEVKSPSSIRKKVSRKGIKPSEFTDGVRTTIYVDNAEQADRAAAMIAKQYPALDDGWQRIPSTGYFDRKLNVIVKDPDGKPVIGEIQLKTPEMGEAAKVGHRWYDISRSLDDKFNEDIPAQKIRTYRTAMEEQQRLYGEAASKADPSIIDLVIDKFRLGGAVAALNRFYRM